MAIREALAERIQEAEIVMDDHDGAGFRRFEAFLEDWSRRDFLRNGGIGLAWIAFAAGGSELLNACVNPGQGSQSPSVQPKKGGHVFEAIAKDVQSFNSTLIGDSVSDPVASMINDSLLTVNESGNLVPVLAERLPAQSSDGLSYIFKLRHDARWTDGRPVTSDDVLFTYSLMFDPAWAKVSAPRRSDLEIYLESISAPDKYTVVFKTKRIHAPFLTSFMGIGILPKHVLGNLAPEAINTADYNTAPNVTNGMYKFVKWDKGQQVTLARNEKYYRGPIYPDTWTFKLTSRTEVIRQLQSSELDIAQIEAVQYDAARAIDTIAIAEYPNLTLDLYLYNLDPAKPPYKMFSEKEVRQALLYALDRKQLVDAIYFGHATVANTSVTPRSWAYDRDLKQIYNFDVGKAEAMLDAAGWRRGSDGVRAKAGTRLEFKIMTNTPNEVRKNLTVAMAEMWGRIGVRVTPTYVDFDQGLVPQIRNTRTFETILTGFQWSVDPDQSALWHSRNTLPGGFNGAFYKNPTLDKVLDDALGTLDRNKRKELYIQMQRILADDLPGPWLVFNHNLIAVNKRVSNYRLGTFAMRRSAALTTYLADQR